MQLIFRLFTLYQYEGTKTIMTNFTYILERLSSRAKNALIMAQLVSEELKHDHIGTEHLCMAWFRKRVLLPRKF